MTTDHPYQDATRSIEQRVEDLLSRMTLEDKAALMFHPILPFGDFDGDGLFGLPNARTLLDRGITHFNILQAPSAREIAEWTNAVQAEVAKSPLGIPVTFSTDPRHSFSDNPATSLLAGPFSQWPEMLGFGALDDEALVERFADVIRREYLAVGIRTALHPQVDIATEPRWSRASTTFGSDADIVGRLGAAYVRGLQGAEIGVGSVSGMAKHFPGGGPQKDGEDPHFSYGREQVYPGDMFEYHLEPFKKLIAAGVSQMMPYYGMPVGTEFEEVGFNFNKVILTDILRNQLGFEGIICTDWGIVSRQFWGVEELTEEERMIKSIDAGVDQFGGETEPARLVGLVRDGHITEARLDESVRRLLREKFRLGLFEQPYVDVAAAEATVGSAESRQLGLEAQAHAQTLLKNDTGTAKLPLAPDTKVYAEGIDPKVLRKWASIVSTPEEADVAVLRVVAPWEVRGEPGDLENFFHAGSLDFHPAELEHIRTVAATVPTIVDVYLDRPAIVAPFLDDVASLIVNFGSHDDAFVQVLFGALEPLGKLPFELPSSMAAVLASREDVPSDTDDPTFAFGFGLRYQDWTQAVPPFRDAAEAEVESTQRWDLDRSPLSEILADPESRTIIHRHLPELVDNPMIAMAGAMSLNAVLGMAASNVDPAVLDELKGEMASL
ncbi:glycoside hydrolase family 3 protein [Curtobacterium sp. VKM Ac-2887]|uniref:glycoside hydrolase family 3 protein n=1 Tax=Curtobacterium sp. VKM Ac-2887 TaxID=2783819 RepID=UPI00188BE9FA|nr:glycoside hydrolase family 3 N-terminal domain-containing protein [Curtobacterium sp. VKM Ac-2887]MBF4585696.1 glycoside hydrolase family 3 C-terminal domain-containing protein [Curtobacterium sp. VKM Ac-2887]